LKRADLQKAKEVILSLQKELSEAKSKYHEIESVMQDMNKRRAMELETMKKTFNDLESIENN
jgi:hypothetical protein